MTPTLAAPGIVLRPLVLADAPALFVALGDAHVQLYRQQSAHACIAETEQYIADTLARSRAAWAITLEGEEAMGRLALRVPEPGMGEFGIVIRAAAQRRGLGLKALRLAEAFAREECVLGALRAHIDAGNVASLSLFAKAGFVETERRPADRVTKLGVRDSIILMKTIENANDGIAQS